MAVRAVVASPVGRSSIVLCALGVAALTGFGMVRSVPEGPRTADTSVDTSNPSSSHQETKGKGSFNTSRSFLDTAPFGPRSEKVSLERAQRESRSKVLVPSDARASRNNLTAAWLADDGRAWLEFSSGVEVSISHFTAPNGFEVDWGVQIATEGFPGRFLYVRDGILAVAVDPSETNQAVLFWEEGGALYSIYSDDETVGELIAVANSMQ